MGTAESHNGPEKMDMPAIDSRACSLGCMMPALTPLGVGAGAPSLTAPGRQIFMIRHGHKLDSDIGWDKFWEGYSYQMDTPLSPKGQSMAEELGNFFHSMKEDGLKVDHLMVSPYLRCLQTAHPIAHALSLRVKVEPGLKEFPGGAIHGNPEWDAEDKMTRQSTRCRMFPTSEDMTYEPLHTDTTPELTPEDYVARLINFAHNLLVKSAGTKETFVWVSHNVNFFVIIALMCGCELKKALFLGKMAPVASVTRLYEKSIGGEWVVDTALGGSISHLSSENAATCNAPDHDEDHPHFINCKNFMLGDDFGKLTADGEKIPQDTTKSTVKNVVDKYASEGSLPKKMATTWQLR